ncbi:MAG: hypothetical protein WAK17_17310 [Candidatus Nitrosopolaris sp.]|jgi:hypothetical protein
MIVLSIRLDDPVTVNSDGIVLKPEKMIINQLYHCIFENKVFLFYKDEEELLHCYEVENPNAVKEISASPSDLETILKKYSHNDR